MALKRRIYDATSLSNMKRWYFMTDIKWDEDGRSTWGCICSRCGTKFEHASSKDFMICPKCGAEITLEWDKDWEVVKMPYTEEKRARIVADYVAWVTHFPGRERSKHLVDLLEVSKEFCDYACFIDERNVVDIISFDQRDCFDLDVIKKAVADYFRVPADQVEIKGGGKDVI